MIRRSVRRAFHTVYWCPPTFEIQEPAIFVPNHHGWHDGYVMYLALSRLGLRNPFHDWIQEYDAFPLFGRVGGMPFPQGDAGRRAMTIRQTVRHLRDGHNMMLFAEGVLHRPPELLAFGKALELLAKQVPNAQIVPVAIRYQHAMHERPEAYLAFAPPVAPGPDLCFRTRLEVAAALDRLAVMMAVQRENLQVLHPGTLDVNERWDMRRLRR